MKSLIAALLTAFICVQTIFSQVSAKENGLNTLTESGIQAQLEFLSSDWMEGRETGTRGNLMAADYIASMFKLNGLIPAGDFITEELSMRDYITGKKAKEYQSYFQTFPLIEFEPGEKQELNLFTDTDNMGKISFAHNTDYKIYLTGNAGEITAPVIFVGYGIKDDEKNYNDFSGIDVKGKFILRLAGYPGHKDTLTEAYKKFKTDRPYLIRRSKNKTAKDLGAAGIIEIANADDIIDWSKNEPFRINLPYYEGDIALPRSSTWMQIPGDTLSNDLIQLSISLRAANEIVKGSGVSFSKFEESVSKDLKPSSKYIKEKNITSGFLSKIENNKNKKCCGCAYRRKQ